MALNDGLLDRMADEAVSELGKGGKGWREMNPNAMILIIYKALKGREKKLLRPLWALVYIAAAAVIGTLICNFLGL